MKNKSHWLIALLVLGISALLLLAVFLFIRTQRIMEQTRSANALLDDLSGQLEGLSQADRTAGQSTESTEVLRLQTSSEEPLSETVPGAAVHEGKEPAAPHTETVLTDRGARKVRSPLPAGHHAIFVGDSRTVGMGKAELRIADTCTYIGQSGEGYRWFVEEGLGQMDEAIRSFPEAPVIFNLGVNDCDHISAYLEVYHDIESAYPDTDFYYMSVNPVTEDSPHVTLSDVLAFNRELKAAFPSRYIDTCSWMLEEGFEDVDGVHYSTKQYRAIHTYAILAVYAMQAEAQAGSEQAATEQAETEQTVPA